jgi:hypothetical protein
MHLSKDLAIPYLLEAPRGTNRSLLVAKYIVTPTIPSHIRLRLMCNLNRSSSTSYGWNPFATTP